VNSMSSSEVLYLSKADVEKLNVGIRDVITAVEEAFREKAAGRVEVPPKPGVHPLTDAFIHAMPAYMSAMRSVGVKWVSGFPDNPKHSLPYIHGVIILNDVETGRPVCIMDGTWVTAKRTGAATAVAAKHLAREDSKVLGILGCGVQGRSNLEALNATCGELQEVRAYDVSEANLRKYAKETSAEFELRVVPADSPKKAVESCDIVVTSGPILRHPKPVIEASWFKSGSFACPLDFDSYWKPEAMSSANKFCTDDREQLDYYKAQGYFAHVPDVYADLGELVSGERPGREDADERIMSMHLGLAIADLATASLVYAKAMKTKAGTWLPL
jgi:ornithine cyclodeaminase/alanine dehydrogenase-like protein (mu-crystallin family)